MPPSKPEPRPTDSKEARDLDSLPAPVRDQLKRLEEERDALAAKNAELDKERIEREDYYTKRLSELDAANSRRADEMEQRFAELNERVKASEERSRQREAEAGLALATLQARAQTLEAATKSNLRREGATGQTIAVKRGDFIAYHPLTGREGLIRGGWFKCSADQEVSRNIPLVSVANENFEYDAGVGAVYHVVNHRPYKRYYKDGERNQIVSDGQPAPVKSPIVQMVPQRLLMPAHSF